jgi:WD40 repeat protein
VAWHPAGRVLATAGLDGTVRFWDSGAARELACFDWEIGRVNRVAFAPDGMTAVAAGHLGLAVRWDVEV